MLSHARTIIVISLVIGAGISAVMLSGNADNRAVRIDQQPQLQMLRTSRATACHSHHPMAVRMRERCGQRALRLPFHFV